MTSGELCDIFDTVIASEAKQSIKPQRRMDCFVASLLAMTLQTQIRIPAARSAPEVCKTVRPKDRGRRESRVLAAPIASRAK
jgi:hypothetical protein